MDRLNTILYARNVDFDEYLLELVKNKARVHLNVLINHKGAILFRLKKYSAGSLFVMSFATDHC